MNLKNVLFSLAFLLFVTNTFADSPLTSTPIYMGYMDIPLIRKADKSNGIITDEQLHFLTEKHNPIAVTYYLGVGDHDNEGRITCAEFDDFFLVTVYVPNSGSELLRLDYRQSWDQEFLKYLKRLEATKPVVVCGDFNVAHKAIDLARPKQNYNKAAGYMQEEIDGMDAFTSNGLIDTFRELNGDEIKYSWWSYRAGARGKNIGWRIDYFLVSESFIPRVKESFILNDVMGSDHCPVGIVIH